MSSGGKGGETTTEIPPEFKQRILSTFDRGEQLAKQAPMTYMGLTQAAPSEATQSWMNQTNDMANLLGLGMASGKPTDSLPEFERDMTGQKGYRAYRGYADELSRQHRFYPERVAQMNALMPGLLDPSSDLRGQGGFKDVPKGGSGAGAGYPGMMNYDQIVARYRRNGGMA